MLVAGGDLAHLAPKVQPGFSKYNFKKVLLNYFYPSPDGRQGVQLSEFAALVVSSHVPEVDGDPVFVHDTMNYLSTIFLNSSAFPVI